MKYMLMIFADEKAEALMSAAENETMLAAYGAYAQALAEGGAMVSGERLRPTTTATTVRVAAGRTEVLDGPYVETKEQLGGYFIIEAPDLDRALAWAARCPGASHGTVEVRPIWPMEGEG